MRTAIKYRLRKIAFSCVLAIGAQVSTVHAENQSPLQPYHIEMVIFERTAAAYNAPEHWPDNVALAYPPNYRVIHTPEESSALLVNQADLAHPEQDTLSSTPENPGIASTHTNDSTEPKVVAERILLERPKSAYLLTNEATRINRKSTMRVLFHKAWQQALDSTQKSPSIIINGGDSFDERSELGGSIRFSVNKFIHVDTQLWLARFTPNYGQELHWPIPPLAPTALNTHLQTISTLESLNLEDEMQDYGINAQSINSAFSDSHNTYTGTMGLQNPQLQNAPYSNTLSDGRFNPNQDQAQLSHLTNEVITLVQSRRMRSKELHYIDHPRLGILIKVIPIKFDEANSAH